MEAKGEREMAANKLTAKAVGIPAGIAMGVGAALAVTAAGSAASAWAILRGFVPEGRIGYYSMTILVLSAVAGSAVAAGSVQRLRAQMCLAAGVGYYLCLLAMTALFFGGRYHGMGVTGVMVFCGSVLVILLAPGSKNRAGSRRRRKRA